MTDQPGVTDLAHALIELREEYSADELRATYMLSGQPVTITVDAQTCTIETRAGRVRIPIEDVAR